MPEGAMVDENYTLPAPDAHYRASHGGMAPPAHTLGLPNIAFCGKAGAGKSAAAELLGELGYTQLSIAAPIKAICRQLWGDDVGREELQKLGEAVVRIHEDTWLNLLLHQLHSIQLVRARQGPVCVDDVRRPNEADALRGEGFVIVRISAPQTLRIDRLKANGKFQNYEQLDDITETALDKYPGDHTLLNTGTKNDLYDKLVDILLRERKRR